MAGYYDRFNSVASEMELAQQGDFMRTRLVCLLCVLWVCCTTAAAQRLAAIKGGEASISGSIAKLDVKSHQSAVITWTRQVATEATKASVTGAVVTDDKGNFSIENLAGGTYALCVRVPNSTFLDPCVWDDPIPTVTVKPGEQSRNNKITLQEGVLFQFQVADSENRIAIKGKTAGVVLNANFLLPHGRSVTVPLVKSDNAGHTLEILVPNDRDLPLVVDGPGLLFLDEFGQPWASNRAAYVVNKSQSGEKSKVTKIQVKGR